MAGFLEFNTPGEQGGFGDLVDAQLANAPGGGSQGGAVPVTPWTPSFESRDDYSYAGGRENPTAGAGIMFEQMFGHNSVHNPFVNTFNNRLAPGLNHMFDIQNPFADPHEFAGYLQNYMGKMTDNITGNIAGPSDIKSLIGSIIGNANGVYSSMTDEEIMRAIGGVMDVATFGAGPAAKAALNGRMKQLAADWGTAALQYGPEQAGNAFMNFLNGYDLFGGLGM